MAEDRTLALLRALMRPGGNPYAFVGDEECVLPSSRKIKAAASPSSQRDPSVQQGDLFRTSPVGQDLPNHPSGNPYASLADLQDEDAPVSNVVTRQTSTLGATKAAFRGECARIFRQYIPALERGRLRDYMRAFVSRNESRSPTVRSLLLHALAKFDLADLRAVPQFNREDESLSEQKLREIERSVGPGQ